MTDKPYANSIKKSGYLIAEMAEYDKPRERFLKYGPDSLRNAELLAILLKTGPRGMSVISLAENILQHFENDLDKLASASTAELQEIHGIGKVKAIEIQAWFALAKRIQQTNRELMHKVVSARDIANYFKEETKYSNQEHLFVIAVNSRGYIIGHKNITVGILNCTLVHSREIFNYAIRASAASIILVHNHPSGETQPSSQDIDNTKKLIKAGDIIGIKVVDHVIIGKASKDNPCFYSSLAELGHI